MIISILCFAFPLLWTSNNGDITDFERAYSCSMINPQAKILILSDAPLFNYTVSA